MPELLPGRTTTPAVSRPQHWLSFSSCRSYPLPSAIPPLPTAHRLPRQQHPPLNGHEHFCTTSNLRRSRAGGFRTSCPVPCAESGWPFEANLPVATTRRVAPGIRTPAILTKDPGHEGLSNMGDLGSRKGSSLSALTSVDPKGGHTGIAMGTARRARNPWSAPKIPSTLQGSNRDRARRRSVIISSRQIT